MDTNDSAIPPQKPDSTDKPAAERFRDTAAARQGDDIESEEMLWEGGYSGKAMYGSWLLAVISTIAVLIGSFWFIDNKGTATLVVMIFIAVVWLGLLGLLTYRKLDVHYQLTSQRFVHKKGILRRTTDRIEVIDIDDVTFVQGIIQRMLGVGTVHITSSDRSHPELALRGIDEVQRIAGLIDDVRRRERRKRGLHIEAI